MRSLCITLMTSVVIASGAQANQACPEKVDVQVNGLVCDFCARALEKVFGAREEVSGVEVDLEKGHVFVEMKPGKSLDDQTLQKLFLDSGYDTQRIDRSC